MDSSIPLRDYKVCVVVPTYNHVLYIEEALNGIIAQKTDFPIIVLVFDDCSTDGTTDVVRKYESLYPELIKGFYFEENQISKGTNTLVNLFSWTEKTEYFAMCEGDDYWIDPFKLQKQVDYMDHHRKCTMTFHSVTEHWQDGSAPDKVFFPVEDRAYSGGEIFIDWIVSSCSVLVRSNVINMTKMREIFSNTKLLYFDQALYMYCATVGDIIGMSEMMGVYRRTNTGYTLNLYSDIKSSCSVIKRYCVHCNEMKYIFGDSLGKKFRKYADFLFVRKALNGVYISICDENFGEALLFMKSAFRCNAIETIKSFFSLSYKFLRYSL